VVKISRAVMHPVVRTPRGALALAGLAVLVQASGAFAAVETVALNLRPCGTPCRRTSAECSTDTVSGEQPGGDLTRVAADLFCQLTRKKTEVNADPHASWRLYTTSFSQGFPGTSAAWAKYSEPLTDVSIALKASDAERDPLGSWRLYTSSFSQGLVPSQTSMGRPF
jgi:hypothetical protein